eukprot:9509057-Alexandrium_andersonii.AAC.1
MQRLDGLNMATIGTRLLFVRLGQDSQGLHLVGLCGLGGTCDEGLCGHAPLPLGPRLQAARNQHFSDDWVRLAEGRRGPHMSPRGNGSL